MRAFLAAILVSLTLWMAGSTSQALPSQKLTSSHQLAASFVESLHLQIDAQLINQKRKATLLTRNSLRINPHNKNSKWLAQKGPTHYATFTQHNLIQQASALVIAFCHYLGFPDSHHHADSGEDSNLIYRFIHDK